MKKLFIFISFLFWITPAYCWFGDGGWDSSIGDMQSVFDLGQSITIADGDNQTFALTNNDTTNNQDAFDLVNSTTGNGFYLNQSGALADDKFGLYVYSNAELITSGSVLGKFYVDNSSSSVEALEASNDGTGDAIEVNANGNGIGIKSTSYGTNHNADIVVNGILASGKHGLRVLSDEIQVNDSLVYFKQDNASSTTAVLELENDGSGEEILVNSTEFVIKDGKVGIGVSPSYPFHVVDNSAIDAAIDETMLISRTGDFSENCVGIGGYSYIENTGTAAMGTGHGIGWLGIATDNVAGNHEMYGIEGRANGKSETSGIKYIGLYGKGNWTDPDSGDGSTFDGYVTSFYASREVYNYGEGSARTEGTSIGLWVPDAVGSASNFGIYVDDQTAGGTADIGIAIVGADTYALWVGSGADYTDSANGVTLGLSGDTNFYRSAANTLKTDDAMIIIGIAYASGFYPTVDNTYYLGKNDDDDPLAFKGVCLKDTTNGKYYRLEIANGVVTATDLTD